VKGCVHLSAALVAAALGVAEAAAGQTLAFPTAEGFGRHAKGGRGGDVYIVSNLNDSGPGSLRECAEASGPRTCVFSVSGEIVTLSRINVHNPLITIAGQTAPGDGIALTNRGGPNLSQPLFISADDAIVRHIRVRPGPSAQTSNNVDALLIGDAKNVIIDHVSLSWGTDETLNVFGNGGVANALATPNTQNVTVQWSMIYESLRKSTHSNKNHSRSTLIGDGVQEVSFHHNLIAHSTRRNPNIGVVGQGDFVNNVLYNGAEYYGEAYNQNGTAHINWVGNIAILGPDTPKKSDRYSINLFANEPLATFHLYVRDNVDINRAGGAQDERLVVDPKDWFYVKTSPQGSGVLSLDAASISGPQQAYRDVLSFAGATRPARDAADARIANEVRGCAGGIIDNPSERGGWPTLLSLPAPADADRDGMADAWEAAKGLNPANAADRNGDLDGDGYTNLEEYLNELAGDHLGSDVGRGVGPAADPTCGAAIGPPVDVGVNIFRVDPPAVRPGESVTITFNGDGATCKKPWNPDLSPFLLKGTSVVVLNATTKFEFFCTRSNLTDQRSAIAFVTPDATIPKPAVTLAADKPAYDPGETVTLEWATGTLAARVAGECLASGAWSGFKSVIGSESFAAEQSGDYGLTCSGPGGTGTASVSVIVGSAPPPPPPPPGVIAIGATVATLSNAAVHEPLGGARLGVQPGGAVGVVIAGPGKSGGATWWRVDFATGVDGWVRQGSLAAH
jgi:pectate lyase